MRKNFFFFNFFCLYSLEKTNLIFIVRLLCFLEFIKRGNYLEKNKISFFSLIKFRKELNIFFSWSDKNYIKFNPKFFQKKKSICFNSFVVYPINKYTAFSENILEQFFFQKLISNWFFFLKKMVDYGVKTDFKKFCFDINGLKKKEKVYKKTFIQINFKNIQKTDLLSKSFSNLKNLTSLISIERNLFGINTNIFFLSLGFLKVNSLVRVHFKNPFLCDFFRKNLQKLFFYEFEPILFSLIRFDPNKGIFFSKIKSFPFEILPSKAKIPVKISLELKKNLYSHKNPILKNKNYRIIRNTPSLYPERFDSGLKLIKRKGISSWIRKKDYFVEDLLKRKGCEFSFTFVFLKKAEDFFNEEFGIIHLTQFDKTFREDQLDIWLNPMLVQSLNFNTGLIEVIPNSVSIHDFKRNLDKKKQNFNDFYLTKSVKFIESLVGYSLFCFFLQVKDRHNANILLNPHKRHIHIDFGFIMGDYPGNLRFEASNFKFSKEFISEIGGKNKEGYELFKDLFIRGFFSIRKNFAKFFCISRKLLFNNFDNYSKRNKINQFQKRIHISKKDNFLIKFIISLIEDSAEDWKTLQYDRYQLHASGIN